MGPGLPEHDDPGLQPERTQLAWTRTMLSIAVVGLLTLRLAALGGGGPYAVLIVVALMIATIAANQARRHRRYAAGVARGGLEPAAASVLALAGGSAVLALVALGHLLTA